MLDRVLNTPLPRIRYLQEFVQIRYVLKYLQRLHLCVSNVDTFISDDTKQHLIPLLLQFSFKKVPSKVTNNFTESICKYWSFKILEKYSASKTRSQPEQFSRNMEVKSRKDNLKARTSNSGQGPGLRKNFCRSLLADFYQEIVNITSKCSSNSIS